MKAVIRAVNAFSGFGGWLAVIMICLALGLALSGPAAARWACVLSALVPYTIWLSRETVLDYWLSAWLAAALAPRLEEFSQKIPAFGVVGLQGDGLAQFDLRLGVVAGLEQDAAQ